MFLRADYQAGTKMNEGQAPLRMKYRRRSLGGRASVGIAGGMKNE
jgi:hypothetical protein